MRAKIDLLQLIEQRNSRYFTRSAPQLSARDLSMIASIMQPNEAKRGTMLLNWEEVSQGFFLIDQGLVRQFYYKNGTDITEEFSARGDLVCCLESTFLRKPTELMVEVLEPTTYYQIDYADIQRICSQSMALQALYSYTLEVMLVQSQMKANEMRFAPILERYINFVHQYPEAAKLAPRKHIASYLLMTPESLSRTRAEAMRKKLI